MVEPYYQNHGVTIIHGDCREVLPTLSPRPDLIIADPPYGVGARTGYGAAGRGLGIERGGRRVCPARNHPPIVGDDAPFDPAHLLAFPNLVLWGANHYADRLPTSHFWLAWDRKCGVGGGTGTDAELAWVRGRSFTTVRIYRHLWAGLLRDSECQQRSRHPAQKPVALMAWCLGWFPDTAECCDPYMGSGAVPLACCRQGVRCTAIECVEEYCELSARRLDAEAAQGRLFVEDVDNGQ